jgi:small GTP-binding protein
MGTSSSNLSNGRNKTLFIGLDSSGKTTLVNGLAGDNSQPTLPTVGFNFESVTHKQTSLVMWDLGGLEKLRDYWATYYAQTRALVIVIDSATIKTRQSEALHEFNKVFQHDSLLDVPILFVANKQDLADACGVEEMTELLQLPSLDKVWHIQPASALTGQGFQETLDWLVDPKPAHLSRIKSARTRLDCTDIDK